MPRIVDTPENRQKCLHALTNGAPEGAPVTGMRATTTWISNHSGLKNVPRTYRLLRRMEVDNLVKRDDRMAGLWHAVQQPVSA
ncbi:MAG: hypothetical protein ABJN42_24820 [Roseibium sp.]|uniref:hypothetical protein n=1 Tax=Roseibium sp. TaxID=1936156 RepID=UPI003299012E